MERYPWLTRRLQLAAFFSISFVLPLALLLMYWAQQHALTKINRTLSAITKEKVTIGAIEATFAPGIAISELKIGESLLVPRVEVALNIQSLIPKISHVALIKPRISVNLDALMPKSSVSSLSKKAKPNRMNSRIKRFLTRLSLSIHQGLVELQSHRYAPLSMIAKDVYLLPKKNHRRLVLGESRLDIKGHEFIRIASGALDIAKHRFKIIRGATLGGFMIVPKSGTHLELLSGKLTRNKGEMTYHATISPKSKHAGNLILFARLSDSLLQPALHQLKLQFRDLGMDSFSALFSPLGIRTKALRISGEIDIQPEYPRFDIKADLSLHGLRVDHKKIAHQPLDIDLAALQSKAGFDFESRTFALEHLSLMSKKLKATLSGNLNLSHASPHIDMSLTIPKTKCQDVLSSLPRQFIPKLEGMSLRGEIGTTLRIASDIRSFDKGKIDFNLKPFSCKVINDPPLADIKNFKTSKASSKINVIGRDGQKQELILNQKNPNYIPYAKISKLIVGAFLSSEDQRFMYHKGFDLDLLKKALLKNLAEARFGRGASTLSQQLAKNLFLSHRRNLSRKFQEAVLTWRLEQKVSKKRILELYFNLVEMGPGIHGVEQAAKHYFNKSAKNLNPLEAAHLAALTPSPRPLALRFKNRQPGQAWNERLKRVLRIMRRRGVISRATQQLWSKKKIKLELHP